MNFPRWRRRSAALPVLTGYPQAVQFGGRVHHVTTVSVRQTWDGWETSLNLVDDDTYQRQFHADDTPALGGTIVYGAPAAYVAELERAAAKLAALEAGGVDNWDGYEAALEEAGIAPWQNTTEKGTTA